MVAFAAVAALACVGGVATPAMATEKPRTNEIGGYTEAEFVDAADNFGYASLAEDAWGDLDAMSEIPVSSVTETGPTVTLRTATPSSDEMD